MSDSKKVDAVVVGGQAAAEPKICGFEDFEDGAVLTHIAASGIAKPVEEVQGAARRGVPPACNTCSPGVSLEGKARKYTLPEG